MKTLLKVAQQHNAATQQQPNQGDSPAEKAMKAKAKQDEAAAKKKQALADSRPENQEYKVVPQQ